MSEVERLWRRGKRVMGALKFLTTLYAIMLVVMILIAIGSVIGLFDNPMIDPGV
jgi:cell division septal protein FtsQ